MNAKRRAEILLERIDLNVRTYYPSGEDNVRRAVIKAMQVQEAYLLKKFSKKGK